MPDILTIYNQLQAFPGTLPWKGGLLDQPYLLMLELSWCKDGVDRYLRALGANPASDPSVATQSPINDAERMAQILAQSI